MITVNRESIKSMAGFMVDRDAITGSTSHLCTTLSVKEMSLLDNFESLMVISSVIPKCLDMCSLLAYIRNQATKYA